MNANYRFASWVVVVFALVCGSATAEEGWSVGKSWKKLWNPDPKAKKDAYQMPTRIVAIWSPAMYNTPGKPATRGFGGRLYFYNQKDQPISVQGQLVVYGFNDSVQRTDSRKPDRKFIFTSKQLSSHYSPAELGASYSVWIPWDGVGGPQLELSLLPVFTAESGQVVMGEQSRNLLPGTTTPSANPQTQQSTVQPFIIDHRVAPASYASPADPAGAMAEDRSFFVHATQPMPQESIRTTSIQLTRGMAERLIQERLQQQEMQPGAPGPNAGPAQQNYYQQTPGQFSPQGNPPTTTYPLPASAMPPNMAAFPVNQLPSQQYPANQTPQLAAHSATRSFNAPTADSRSWGPTVPRIQPTQNSRSQSPSNSQTPASLVGGQTAIGQSPTRYAPGQLPVPMTASPLPAPSQQPIEPGPGAQGYLPPSPPQSGTYPSAQASWHTAPAAAR